jgi:hypothetical protein
MSSEKDMSIVWKSDKNTRFLGAGHWGGWSRETVHVSATERAFLQSESSAGKRNEIHLCLVTFPMLSGICLQLWTLNLKKRQKYTLFECGPLGGETVHISPSE